MTPKDLPKTEDYSFYYRLSLLEKIKILEDSGLFDKEWYLEQ